MKTKKIPRQNCSPINLISIISLPACSQSNPVSLEISYEDFLYEQHFTWAVNAEVGQTIVVTLGSNPTTGFTWPDTAQISNQKIVKQIDHNYISPQGNTAAGVSGKDVWTFKATEEGYLSLRSSINTKKYGIKIAYDDKR